MADIRVVWNADLMSGDWLLAPPDLDGSRQLVTAVAVALFTHRTARSDDVLPHDTASRRGWWADHESGAIWQGWPIGSRLWLLSREKQTEVTRGRAEDYIREALDPFIEAGVIAGYDLTVAWFAPERLGAEITLYRGQDRIAVQFETLWDELDAPPASETPPGTLPQRPPQTHDYTFSEEFA